MQCIYSAEHPTEAHIIRGILESQGVRCEVRGEGIFGLKGELPCTQETDPTIWLLYEAQYPIACQIIQDYEHTKRVNALCVENWVCQSCGEESEVQFGVCWKCEQSRL